MPQLLRQISVLAVVDLDRSVAFYVEKLGMDETLRAGGWSFLQRGAFRLRLGHCPDDEPANKEDNASLFAQVEVEDATSLYGEFVAKGVEMAIPLCDREWGVREFAIVTVDGHRILFIEDL